MFLAAITGGIGSGKSTVSAGLAARGAGLVDADRIARQVVEPGAPAYAGVVERFGLDVLHADGTLNRPALAAIVFADAAARADLEAVTHPAITAVIGAQIDALAPDHTVVLVDLPLLRAAGPAGHRFDAVIVVDAPPEIAVARLVAYRGFDEADARARLAAQIGREERRARADLVIENAGSRTELDREVERVWRWLEARAGEDPLRAGPGSSTLA